MKKTLIILLLTFCTSLALGVTPEVKFEEDATSGIWKWLWQVDEDTTKKLGYAVASGDFNCDDHDDLVVGIPYKDNYEIDSGGVIVFFGTEDGIDIFNGANVQQLQNFVDDYPGEEDASEGFALSAGDLNGDGCDDIAVGAPFYTTGHVGIYLGDDDDDHVSLKIANLTISGEATDDKFGYSLLIGNLANDSYDDLIIGAPGFGKDEQGAVYVCEGQSTYPYIETSCSRSDGGRDYAVSDAGLGTSLTRVRIDGKSEYCFASGAPYSTCGSYTEVGHLVRFCYPTATPDSGIVPVSPYIQKDMHFGFSIASSNALFGTGDSDIIIGVPDYDNGSDTDAGRVMIWTESIMACFPANTPCFEHVSAMTTGGSSDVEENARFGFSVANIGDLSGTSDDEILIGAPGYDGDKGKVYMITTYGTYYIDDPTWVQEGDEEDELFGSSVLGKFDIDDDSTDDFAVGAPGIAGNFVKTYDGSSATPYDELPLVGGGEDGALSARAGYEVLLIPANIYGSDNEAKLTIGAPGYATSLTADPMKKGAIYFFDVVINGSNEITSIGLDQVFYGDRNGEYCGYALDYGDINGDDEPDLVASCPMIYINQGGIEDDVRGNVHIWYGDNGVIDGNPDLEMRLSDEEVFDLYGASISVGDVNDDGYDDLLVGSSEVTDYFDWSDEGHAYLYLGSSSGLCTTAEWSEIGETTYGQYGYEVRIIGDMNNDGYNDWVVNDPLLGVLGDFGRVYLYSGEDESDQDFGDELETIDLYEANEDGDQFGNTLRAFENRLLIGCPGCDNTEDRDGKVFMFRYQTGPGGPELVQMWEYAGYGSSTGELGHGIAVGDFDDDAETDIALSTIDGGWSAYREGLNGTVEIFLDGTSATPDEIIEDDKWNADFGFSLSAGDTNRDDYDDLLIGIPRWFPHWDFQAWWSYGRGSAQLINGTSSGLE